ncbi:uncharacterized protein [Triticum aestivum]|uniref:uncharacterized protein isoform X2 n=1 Tax=Triticum aestivum TaxID=4565 RepID=UPI000989D0DA|nr:uncharacterized protein LOC123121992 isoform X2 [Triticum aestivum]
MSLFRVVPANAGPYAVAPRATVVRFITLRSTVARPGLAGLSSQAHGRYLMCRAMVIKLISLIWNEWISVPSTCHTLQRHDCLPKHMVYALCVERWSLSWYH